MSLFIFVVGPTASGKSALALRLAQRFSAAILNCDSLQFYQRLDIGTAKPPPRERALVPHFLFDIVPPGEILTAGDFRRAALDVLAREIPVRPVFGVGGSGFYIQALEKGMFDVPKPDPAVERAVRERFAQFGVEEMHAELARRDPQYAATLNPQDAYRILRALILMEDSGKTVSEVRASFTPRPFPYPLLKLGLAPSREDLLPRVSARVESMFRRGFLGEVRALLEEGWGDWPPLASVGYKECVQCLRGEIARERLEPLVVERTMQLAKKQKTWFKRDPDIHWLNAGDPFADAAQRVAAAIDRSGPAS